jgi:hypothetical protein
MTFSCTVSLLLPEWLDATSDYELWYEGNHLLTEFSTKPAVWNAIEASIRTPNLFSR